MDQIGSHFRDKGIYSCHFKSGYIDPSDISNKHSYLSENYNQQSFTSLLLSKFRLFAFKQGKE